MKQKLTKTLVDSLSCPAGKKDIIVYDTELTGFAVRVTASGSKLFLLQYTRASQASRLPDDPGKRDAQTKRLTLGKYGEVTVHEARQAALVARGQLVQGGDPVTARNAQIAATEAEEAARRRAADDNSFTLAKLVTAWEEIGLRKASKKHRYQAPRAIRNMLANHLDRPAHELTRGLMQELVDELVKTAPIQAIRTRNYARTAYGWAVKRHLVPSNPVIGVEVEVKEESRDNVLTAAEVGEVWRAAGHLNHPWGSFFKILLLTLQRRNEVAGMEWGELSADFSTWTVPASRAKNGKAHIVHLAEPARKVLRAIPRLNSSNLVFTTGRLSRNTGSAKHSMMAVPISGFTRAKSWLIAEILKEREAKGLTLPPLKWVLHDFRRTGVSKMRDMGIDRDVADRILNHVKGGMRGVMAVYQRSELLPERERAIDVWTAYVLRMAEGVEKSGSVVQLKPRVKPRP